MQAQVRIQKTGLRSLFSTLLKILKSGLGHRMRGLSNTDTTQRTGPSAANLHKQHRELRIHLTVVIKMYRQDL